MKKAIWVVCILAVAVWIAGCSLVDKTAMSSAAETPASTGSASPSPSESPVTTDTPAAASDGESPEPSVSTDDPEASFTPPTVESGDSDFITLGEALLNADGIGSLRINMTESELIAAIGEPKAKTDPEAWGADGLQHSDWNYEEKGLVINMAEAPEAGTFIVFSIKAMAPCALETDRGIAIGDAKDSVLDAYAKEYNEEESDENALVLGSVYGGMIVTVDDGKVVEIFVGAAAE